MSGVKMPLNRFPPRPLIKYISPVIKVLKQKKLKLLILRFDRKGFHFVSPSALVTTSEYKKHPEQQFFAVVTSYI